MELVLCGLFAATGMWVATGGRKGRDAATPVRLQALKRRVRTLLAFIGSSRVSGLLLMWAPYALVCEALAKRCPRLADGRQVGLSEASAVSLCATCLLALAGGVAVGSPVGAVIALACTAAGMAMRKSAHERALKLEVAREMPSVLRTLSTALASGQTLVQALEYVGLHETGPAAEVFARASLRLRCSMSADEALTALQGELDAPGVGLMACALAISQRTGSPLRELFQRSAVLVERQGDLERLLSVRTAQVRLSVRVVCGLPPLMVLLLATISPDYRLGLASGAGIACLGVALVLDAAALIAIRAIMRGVLV